MKAYYSKWNNFDLRKMAETNKLRDVVKYYGGYLWYTEKLNGGAFDAFYKNTNESMANIFINRANAKVKKHLASDIPYMSGRKMKRFLITGYNKRIVSYDWMVNYVEYILNECFNNETLVDRVKSIVTDECLYCIRIDEMRQRIIACSKRLLGFQYDLLQEVSCRGNRMAQRAKKTMDKIAEFDCWKSIISQCSVK